MHQYWGDTALYGFFNGLSFYLVLIFNLINLKKKEKILSRITSNTINCLSQKKHYKKWFNYFFIVLEIYLFSLVQYELSLSFNRPFGNLVGTGANYFSALFLAPLFVSLFAFLTGTDIFKQMDLITPAYPLGLVLVKLACFCQGCCRGIESSFGLYNHQSDRVEFPVQLVELGLAALLFVFLLLIRKKAKEGTMFPIYMIVYSATRFFSEFLRTEENVLFILKRYHILCLVAIVVGAFWLFVVKKFRTRIQKLYIDYFDAVEKVFKKILAKVGKKRKNKRA